MLRMLDGGERKNNVRLLVKDGCYLSVESEHLIFRDFLRFQANRTSLRAILEQNRHLFGPGESFAKLHFPYKILCLYENLDLSLDSVKYEDFENTIQGGQNSLNEEFATYQYLLPQFDNDIVSVLREMKIDRIPMQGRQKLDRLRQEWTRKGMLTVRDLLLEYEEADVVPLKKVVEREIEIYAANAHVDLLSFTTASSISYTLGIYASERSGSPHRLCNPTLMVKKKLTGTLLGGFACVFNRICCLGGKIRPFESEKTLGRPHERIRDMFIMDVSGSLFDVYNDIVSLQVYMVRRFTCACRSGSIASDTRKMVFVRISFPKPITILVFGSNFVPGGKNETLDTLEMGMNKGFRAAPGPTANRRFCSMLTVFTMLESKIQPSTTNLGPYTNTTGG